MTRQNFKLAGLILLPLWALYVLLPPLQRAVSSVYDAIATGLHSVYRGFADLVAPVLWTMSANRALFAAAIILILLGLLIWSIMVGLRQSKIREKDEVFGDPERTKGGWYWMICGLASLGLVWFYFSWGTARAFFPNAANEICQVASLNTAMAPIGGALPPRFYAGTEVVLATQAEIVEARQLMAQVDLPAELEVEVNAIIVEIDLILSELSDPSAMDPSVQAEITRIAGALTVAAGQLRDGSHPNAPGAEELAASKASLQLWGVAEEATKEIPFDPTTERGAMFITVANDVELLGKDFQALKNLTPERRDRIDALKDRIAVLKETFEGQEEALGSDATRVIRKLQSRSRALARGTVFPPNTLDPIQTAMEDLKSASARAQGGLWYIDAFLLPTDTINRTTTVCTEYGSGRWLPKPMDVVARFGEMANIHLNRDAADKNPVTDKAFLPGGMKGERLLWVKWLPIQDIAAPLLPEFLADMIPGSYPSHSEDGTFNHNLKSRVLAVTQGEVNLGYIPMLDGHVWDSLYRVIVAMALGIGIGVPFGIMMGASRFFKSFFDPLIELYRPIPPLAWAPLVLTAIGIGDAGKITLLFMVALAIMIISARTGAISTQLTKIRASHSLGASPRQILRQVILPNAMPEILTGIRIAIGVCWGTLVAAELLAGKTGIGFVENVASKTQDYTTIWVTILIMGMLGFALDLLMRWVIDKTIPWRGKG